MREPAGEFVGELRLSARVERIVQPQGGCGAQPRVAVAATLGIEVNTLFNRNAVATAFCHATVARRRNRVAVDIILQYVYPNVAKTATAGSPRGQPAWGASVGLEDATALRLMGK